MSRGFATAGLWREEALARAGRLKQRSTVGLPNLSQEGKADFARDVKNAEDFANARQGVAAWWTGSLIEGCWRNLRLAEELAFLGSSASEVQAQSRVALAHGIAALGSDDIRVKALQSMLDKGDPPDPPDTYHAVGYEVLVASHEAADRKHRELRSFRNGLRILVLLLLILALTLLAGVGFWGWKLLPTPSEMTPLSLVSIALFFGALGALFSAIPSLAQVPEQSTPFNPIAEQAALKVVIGAWSAIVGLLAVSAGIATPAADASKLAGFAMVAALFGAGQEAITRFADHKATDLRNSTP